MTPGAPDSPDSAADAALEAALRSRLREVDRLTPPPPPDFAASAMRAAPPEDDEVVAPVVPLRPAWPRWLLGAAAAILVVGGVGYGLGHGGGASSTAGSAGVGAEAAVSQADSATTLTTTASGPRDGSADGGSNLAAALAAVKGERGASYGDVVTATTVGTSAAPHADAGTTAGTTAATAGPAMVTVYLTRLEDPVVALFTTSLPGGTSITFVRSSYSANACAATLARVSADLPTLARLGGGLSRPRCDTQGRVDITSVGGLSSSQRVTLQTDYGDTVQVVDGAGNPVG